MHGTPALARLGGCLSENLLPAIHKFTRPRCAIVTRRLSGRIVVAWTAISDEDSSRSETTAVHKYRRFGGATEGNVNWTEAHNRNTDVGIEIRFNDTDPRCFRRSRSVERREPRPVLRSTDIE